GMPKGLAPGPGATNAHAGLPSNVAGCLATWRGCLATRPFPIYPPRPAHPGRPQAATLPLFFSVLRRAGYRGATGGGERGSSRWTGIAAAAPPASGVKERPWHPLPQGSVSSTLCNRARPVPTGDSHLSDQAQEGPCLCLRECLRLDQGLARGRRAGRRKQTEHPVHQERGSGKARDGAGSGRGEGMGPRARAALPCHTELSRDLRCGRYALMACWCKAKAPLQLKPVIGTRKTFVKVACTSVYPETQRCSGVAGGGAAAAEAGKGQGFESSDSGALQRRLVAVVVRAGGAGAGSVAWLRGLCVKTVSSAEIGAQADTAPCRDLRDCSWCQHWDWVAGRMYKRPHIDLQSSDRSPQGPLHEPRSLWHEKSQDGAFPEPGMPGSRVGLHHPPSQTSLRLSTPAPRQAAPGLGVFRLTFKAQISACYDGPAARGSPSAKSPYMALPRSRAQSRSIRLLQPQTRFVDFVLLQSTCEYMEKLILVSSLCHYHAELLEKRVSPQKVTWMMVHWCYVGMCKWAHLSLDTGLYGRSHEDASSSEGESTDQCKQQDQQAAVGAEVAKQPRRIVGGPVGRRVGIWGEVYPSAGAPPRAENRERSFLELGVHSQAGLPSLPAPPDSSYPAKLPELSGHFATFPGSESASPYARHWHSLFPLVPFLPRPLTRSHPELHCPRARTRVHSGAGCKRRDWRGFPDDRATLARRMPGLSTTASNRSREVSAEATGSGGGLLRVGSGVEWNGGGAAPPPISPTCLRSGAWSGTRATPGLPLLLGQAFQELRFLLLNPVLTTCLSPRCLPLTCPPLLGLRRTLHHVGILIQTQQLRSHTVSQREAGEAFCACAAPSAFDLGFQTAPEEIFKEEWVAAKALLELFFLCCCFFVCSSRSLRIPFITQRLNLPKKYLKQAGKSLIWHDFKFPQHFGDECTWVWTRAYKVGVTRMTVEQQEQQQQWEEQTPIVEAERRSSKAAERAPALQLLQRYKENNLKVYPYYNPVGSGVLMTLPIYAHVQHRCAHLRMPTLECLQQTGLEQDEGLGESLLSSILHSSTLPSSVLTSTLQEMTREQYILATQQNNLPRAENAQLYPGCSARGEEKGSFTKAMAHSLLAKGAGTILNLAPVPPPSCRYSRR
ncbi:hypothetical protein J0S82_020146, partial [Galemys pyrenaicus]